MISVSNFYWVLYHQLLAPVGLTCLYYYPFGTKQQLIENQFDCYSLDYHRPSMVLFHWDQEPLFDQDTSYIAKATHTNIYKFPRIFANSEHSRLKKQVVKDLHLLDWYFFYHGFAALDWYRDAAYIDYDSRIQNKFCFLNHIVTRRRSYRMALLARLNQSNLLPQGTVSFHGDYHDCANEIKDSNSLLCDSDKALVENYLIAPKIQRMIADTADIDGDASARFGVNEYQLRQNSFLQVVGETVFFEDKQHLTEKIFQPIVHMRPFVLVSSPGNLAYLKSYGFKTFDPWIGESYDHEPYPTKRLDMMHAQIEKICAMSMEQLQTMLDEMYPVLEFNKRHFFTRFRDRIVDEMLDNFDSCLRQWNTSRVIHRMPLHPDLDHVRKILLSSC